MLSEKTPLSTTKETYLRRSVPEIRGKEIGIVTRIKGSVWCIEFITEHQFLFLSIECCSGHGRCWSRRVDEAMSYVFEQWIFDIIHMELRVEA